ncbi:UTP--glucose-1-phosphate uridylyltransferase [Candidatus Falkowbacteria bacterium RBG_13_39_14]|uniref:UTP--glucose-1-phosphate uridylyltransferase n=1 Tax=Candidatus Falkowbacteria bacterium RBG_13_39_14 TaxID=1797985 RepID=A0A1F5S0Y5_9BACT|nr:MAG: UTP--glucose-1-phosphate uridylyltransferase [Candidatus Falkowbacteria bacterium RBG_13_39_14]
MLIRKAIIPVAGFGTRFLPATKAQPKEMLPIVDKPIIQYLVEEAAASGIKEIIFVTGRGKRAIEDHFDHSFELEHNLVEKGKRNLLEKIYKISRLAKFAYVRQPEPLGDGHAILCAKRLVNDEPCAVLYGDDIVQHKVPCLKQLIRVYEKYEDPVIALEEIEKKEVEKYGIVKVKKTTCLRRQVKQENKKTTSAIKERFKNRIFEIEDIVEKPSIKKAPSNLAIVGKYIITRAVMDALENLKPDKSGEIRLADALKKYLEKKSIYGYKFQGTRYDCGSKLGFLKATVDFGLRHEEVGKEFGEFIENRRINTE